MMRMFRVMATGVLTFVLVAGLAGCVAERDIVPDVWLEEGTQKLHQAVPAMINAMSRESKLNFSYSRDREISCLRPEIKEQQSKTYWIITSEATVTELAAGKEAVASAAKYLTTSGWTNVGDKPLDPMGIAGTAFVKDNLSIAVEAIKGFGDRYRVEILAQSRCYAHPMEHQMTRSTNDPDFGKSSSYYLDE